METVKIVVVSDAHTYLKGFDQVIYKEPDADYYLDLGDNFCGMQPTDTFEEWWESVRGNNDGPFFPDQQDIILFDKVIRMIHGDQILWKYRSAPEMFAYMDEEGVDILLHGHTHVRRSDVIVDEHHKLLKAIINPGSLALSREHEIRKNHQGTYCVLTLTSDGQLTYQFKTIHISF